MDDDLIIKASDIEFGITSWQVYSNYSFCWLLNCSLRLQKFRHLLIGYKDRTRRFDVLTDGTYRYSVDAKKKALVSPDNTPGYSIILPAVFIHRAYLKMMFDPAMISPELIAYIDEIMNCDDILINIMVTKFLQDCGLPQGGALKLSHNRIENLEGTHACCEL